MRTWSDEQLKQFKKRGVELTPDGKIVIRVEYDEGSDNRGHPADGRCGLCGSDVPGWRCINDKGPQICGRCDNVGVRLFRDIYSINPEIGVHGSRHLRQRLHMAGAVLKRLEGEVGQR